MFLSLLSFMCFGFKDQNIIAEKNSNFYFPNVQHLDRNFQSSTDVHRYTFNTTPFYNKAPERVREKTGSFRQISQDEAASHVCVLLPEV